MLGVYEKVTQSRTGRGKLCLVKHFCEQKLYTTPMTDFTEHFLHPANFNGFFSAQAREELRRKRLSLGLSYCALGRFLGVHWSTIRKWEYGIIQHCSLSLQNRIASFLRGEYDFDIQANLGDPRLGAYLRPVTPPAIECVHRLASCYHLLESRPDLRSLLLDAAFQAAREALLQIKEELEKKDAQASKGPQIS